MLLLLSFSLKAQVNQDTVKGYNKKDLKMPNPESILEAYSYDPETDRYIYTKTFEGFNIEYPIVLTPEQYQKLIRKEATRKYFQEKADAIDGKKEASKDKKKNLLPRYYINSSFFEAIFGSNTIDVKPTGSVEVDLGARYSKQDNPAFSENNRSATTFDFSQRVNLSLLGMVGTRLKVTANYDTQSTFAFQNLIKLEYQSNEDDIIQKIEVGNVSMPLNSTLIRGAQSLFGVKTELKFGKTTVTGVFSEQKSQTKTVTSQGGGTIQEFNLFGLDYDADRHFFLSQYFRNKYDTSLSRYPFIDSRVQIKRIEVWVTNRQNRVTTGSDGNNLRNVIALADIGESKLNGITNDSEIISINPIPGTFFNSALESPPNNGNNNFDPTKIGQGASNLNSNIRDVSNVSNGFQGGVTANEGVDYAKLENARKLSSSEYTFHPQLGYISLNQRLANDEVLAVAYQYTIGDTVYQVGEFGTDGVDATNPNSTGTTSSQALILKMLKGNLTNVIKPTWNLMMKNIYQIPGAFQLDPKDFKFNIVYSDPSPLNYITPTTLSLPSNVEKTPLIKVFNLDKLNSNNDPQEGGDGFFDFIPGLTVDPQNGRIIFTTVEPFGKHLFEKLRSNALEDYNNTVSGYNDNQKKYVFRNLYRKTNAAALEEADKNKFQLKGKFKSSSGDGISLGASNVPKGSVVVTAGGRVLQEGIDYTVNYQAGRVQILDPSIQASGVPIQVSVENNSVFGQQTRRFMGINVEHKFSNKFQIGATYLNLSERPFTQKSNYSQESVNNSMFGLNTIFSTEVPFLTRLANKLPFVDTDVPSNLSFRGEVAFLQPGTPSADKFNGESTVYVDDFEGSQSAIDMKSPLAWSLSSVPIGFENGALNDDLKYGYKRAKLSWYTIDPIFYSGSRPAGLNDNDVSTQATRRIYSRELFPKTDIAAGETTVVPTLDLTYYPQERGPYNFNPSSTNNVLPNPQDNFGGITRSITSTNFEQANVEYIQFWMLDPYYTKDGSTPITTTTNTGKLTFNLGEVSEDILRDGKKLYENGLPTPDSSQQALTSNWGKVPAAQSLIYAFDANETNRALQDVGLNGLTDAEENSKYPSQFSGNDPAQDNYQYYGSASGSVVDRYKNYNGTEGNSPVNVSDANRGSTVIPDVEDINRDNTMNTINTYFKFTVDIKPDMVVGDKYVADVQETSSEVLPNGRTLPARWIQFKIPIREVTLADTEGSISDFRSIRFMRMFLSGFTDKVTLRFGTLDLIRGEWRRYITSLQNPNTAPPLVVNDDPVDDPTGFDVVGVNLQDNSNRSPIRYVMPPGVQREQLYNNNTVLNQNEQSLALRVYDKNDIGSTVFGLEPGDARAAFKNVSVDMRQYKKLKMFLHAEALPKQTLADGQLSGFIRFGNDFTDNFYQIEVPLKVTREGDNSPEQVWPAENEIDIATSVLTALKVKKISGEGTTPDANGIMFIDASQLDPSAKAGLKVGIKGNPNFGQVRTLMVGVRNRGEAGYGRGEVWFNELRMAELENEGGMAAIASLDTNMADLATLSATGRMSTIGFGSIEQRPNERSREDVKQYDIVTNVNVGKLMPKKWGMNIPFNYAVGEQIITPEYDPFYQDIKLKQLIDITQDQDKKDFYRDRAIDYTKRKSFNLIGVRKDRSEKQKQHFYDPENLTLSYSFTEVEHHDPNIENALDQQLRTSADYTYTFKSKPVEPFKKVKYFSKSNYWKLLSDFNFNYLPNNINFSSTILRQYNRQQFRQVEVEGIGLDPLYKRNYMFNYNYGFGYNLTKALRFNYTATSANLVRNYLDENNRPIDSNTIWTDFWNIGTPNQHAQQLTVNYELPINKIPLLSFIKSDYTYTGDYSWQRASIAMQSITDTATGINYDLGNTIQNANSHKLNTTFTMSTLYKYLGLVKSTERIANKKPVVAPPVKAPKPGEKVVAKPKEKQVQETPLLDAAIGVLTSIKNVQVTYNETNGTMLPGYLPSIGFLGSSKPSLGFVFGMQDDVRFEAARNGWLTEYPNFNQNFTQLKSKRLSGTATVEPFADFKIELMADRNISENFSEQFNVQNGQYHSLSPYNTGNFSISTNLIKTAFAQSDEFGSATFEEFRNNRLIVAHRLAEAKLGAGYAVETNTTSPNYGYPVGFGRNSQQVLLPSFLAAYTGSSAGGVSLDAFRNIPIPNWTLKYTGLMRYKLFKDTFKRFSIQHAYKAAYTINSFKTNLNPEPKDVSGNYQPQVIIGNVNLTEQFSPLIRFDFEMKNSIKILAEMKKDRTLSLSFDNALLTELKGTEYIVGLGYRIKDVKIRSSLADNPEGVIKSDINFRGDLSLRKNMTVVRNLDTNNNQLGGGQDILTAKLSGDYSFSKNLTALFFFDYSFSESVISTTFPITNIRTGFTVRYNFGN